MNLMRLFGIVSLVVLLSLLVSSQECDAQLLRGLFNRGDSGQRIVQQAAPPIFVKPAGHIGHYVPQDYSAPTVFPTRSYYERNQFVSRILDGKMTDKYRHPAEVDSRYIGGFHQSHFQNIGIPSGDIGLRGNAYNWRTW